MCPNTVYFCARGMYGMGFVLFQNEYSTFECEGEEKYLVPSVNH